MKSRRLMFAIVLSFLTVAVMTGCGNEDESKQENGHGHSHG